MDATKHGYAESRVVLALADKLRSEAAIAKQTQLPIEIVNAALASLVSNGVVTGALDIPPRAVFRLSDDLGVSAYEALQLLRRI
jgi:hypothetical protein